MSRFAVNYSPSAARLLKDNPNFHCHYFKCPDWPYLVAEVKKSHPVVVHFDIMSGNGAISEEKLRLVQTLLDDTDTVYVNTHFAPFKLSQSDRPSRGELLARVTEDILQLCDRFGPERIIVENVYDSPLCHNNFTADPDIISEVIESTHVGLLLDLAHARVASIQQQVDFIAYLQRLPLDRIRELHITGVGYIDGHLEEHLEMTTEDWSHLLFALRSIRKGDWPAPSVIAFEFGGVGGLLEDQSNEKVLRKQFPQMWDMFWDELGAHNLEIQRAA